MLSKLSTSQTETLLNFLHHTKATGVFEVLNPSYQHVVDLSYLHGQSALKFIAWTSAFKDESSIESFCSIRPDKAIDFARSLGINTITVKAIFSKKPIVIFSIHGVKIEFEYCYIN